MSAWTASYLAVLGNWPMVLGLVLFILLAVYFVGVAPRRKVNKWPFLTISDDKRLQLENEFRKTNAQVLGGAFLLIGLYYTGAELSISRQAENFNALTKAIELLGKDSPQEQTGAVYVLEQAVREDPGKRIPVLSILASFIRFATGDQSTKTKTSSQVAETALWILSDILSGGGTGCTDVPFPDLSEAKFPGRTLSRINLSNTNLDTTDFTGSDLNDADLSCANLKSARFADAILIQADFTNANLKFADFAGANLKFADFAGADLRTAKFAGAIINGAEFQDALHWKASYFDDSNCNEDGQPPKPKSIAEACGFGKRQ